MIKWKSLILPASIVAAVMLQGPAFAAGGPQPDCPRRPYGGYCQGPRWGWYGAKNPVKTADDARARLEKFFQGQGMTIGAIIEHPLYFKADIKDAGDALVDRVIIDKRTGRIRSVL